MRTDHLLEYKKHLAGSGLAPSSQARTLETLRCFFRWAQAEGLIDRDPAALVKSPRALQGQDPAYTTTDEMRRLIGAAPAGKYAARDHAMAWALAYGLRIGEVAALNCADILPAHDGRIPALRVTGKGTRQRVIPLADNGYQALRAYAADRTGPLFVCTYGGDAGRRMTTRALQKRFDILAELASLGTDKAHPHACRHGAAQRWLFESTVPGGIYTVSRMLGHTRVSTTERYLRLNNAALEGAVLSDPLALSGTNSA